MIPTVTPDELKAAWIVIQCFQGQAQRPITMPELSRALISRCAQVAIRVERGNEPLTDQLFREVAEMQLP
jgi:hypothetical protein